MSAEGLQGPLPAALGDERLLRNPLAAGLLGAGVIALAFAVLPFDRALVSGFTAAVLVVLSAIDLERRIIPNRIVLPAAGVVLLAQLVLYPDRALEWILAALVAAFVLMIPRLLGRSWMGMGDVKLALLLGVALGWGTIGAVLLAFVCTLPVSMLVLFRGGISARSSSIPFGPFLSLGALLVMFGPALLLNLPAS